MLARDLEHLNWHAANGNSTTGFAVWQRRYAEHGIATFPVAVDASTKKPMIRNYGRVGLRGSEQLVPRFRAASALGFMAGRRSRIMVADLDDTHPRIIEEAERLFGSSPLVWRTGGNKYALAYRHNGESRLIRPFNGVPIDILGGGLVVAPGSMGARRPYEIIRGSLDDLDRLPVATIPDEIARQMKPAVSPTTTRIAKGRNDALFRKLLRHAPRCDDIEGLFDVARTINDDEFAEPLGDHELEKTVRSAWGYEQRGSNWVGAEQRVQIAKTLVQAFADHQNGADALLLHHILLLCHRSEAVFAASPIALWQAKIIPCWSRERYRRALATMVEIGAIRIVRQGGRGTNDPRLYAFPNEGPKGPDSGHNITKTPLPFSSPGLRR